MCNFVPYVSWRFFQSDLETVSNEETALLLSGVSILLARYKVRGTLELFFLFHLTVRMDLEEGPVKNEFTPLSIIFQRNILIVPWNTPHKSLRM